MSKNFSQDHDDKALIELHENDSESMGKQPQSVPDSSEPSSDSDQASHQSQMASILERPDEEDEQQELMSSGSSKPFNEDHFKLSSNSVTMKFMQMIRGDGAIGPEMSFWQHFERLVEILQRPAVFITLILITILMLLSFEYGSMQRQLNLMEDHMKKMHNREKDLLTQLGRLRGDVRRITTDEKRLKQQENKLDKEFKKMQDEVKKIEEHEKHSWGEQKDGEDQMTVHQSPLQPHLPMMGPFSRPLPPFLQGIGKLFQNAFNDIHHEKPLEPPHTPQFSLPHFSFLNNFHELPPMPEIEIIEVQEDEPTEKKPAPKPKNEFKVQKIG